MNPVGLAIEVGRMLDDLGIQYAVGGSVASSLFGEPRSTLDIDLALRGTDDELFRLIDRADADFYVPIEAARQAVTAKDSFNLLHNESGIKIDIFVLGDDLIDVRQIERRVRISLEGGDLWVTSPEDIILRKLSWYRLTEETSQRQWRDVIALLRATKVDTADVLDVAVKVGLGDLAEKAVAEAVT